MSSMEQFDAKMTLICDEVRELLGETGTLGLDKLQSNLDNANNEISTQKDLISQITTALEGKATAGGGGTSISYDTCTVELSTTKSSGIGVYSYTKVNDDGALESICQYTSLSENTLHNVLCGSCISLIHSGYSILGYTISGNISLISKGVTWGGTNVYVALSSPTGAGEIASISFYDND